MSEKTGGPAPQATGSLVEYLAEVEEFSKIYDPTAGDIPRLLSILGIYQKALEKIDWPDCYNCEKAECAVVALKQAEELAQ